MFREVTVRGGRGSLLWGYRAAATCTAWTIARHGREWRLTATCDRVDPVQLRMAMRVKELLFTAPRDRGRWCWEVTDLTVGTREVRATLGRPLQ